MLPACTNLRPPHHAPRVRGFGAPGLSYPRIPDSLKTTVLALLFVCSVAQQYLLRMVPGTHSLSHSYSCLVRPAQMVRAPASCGASRVWFPGPGRLAAFDLLSHPPQHAASRRAAPWCAAARCLLRHLLFRSVFF